ncbi:MAG TPA: zf-HC2 domain-containing protein [Trebonia sp.]|jgi:hypothetical protein
MTKPMECADARVALGVYVLGAIDTVERTQVDAHLAGCHDCRDELAGLAGLPALLSRVDAAEAMALAESDGPPAGQETAGHAPKAEDPPPRELLATVISLTSARRRRRVRDAILAAAAAVVIAAGVVGGLRLGSSTPPPSATAAGAGFNAGPAAGPWQTMNGHAQDMTATVQYRSMGWGTELAAKVTGIPVGTPCQMWVIGKDGTRTLAASWVVDNNEGKVSYPASAAVAADQVHGFVITVGTSSQIPVTS